MGEREEQKSKIVNFVKEERKILPRAGGRKILHLIDGRLEEHSLQIGRDRFFDLLREKELLVKARQKIPRTTYSGHSYAVQPNVFVTLDVTAPGQAAVADITYLRISRSFGYLFLLTDAYSKRIVGWHLSDSLAHDGAIRTLQKAAGSYTEMDGLVHHSDRGCQYCCHDFLDELRKYEVVSSMTDADHCAQNAMAERVNGILKDEFYLDLRFRSFKQAHKAVTNAICIYNSYRPHLSLGMKTPNQIHFADVTQSNVEQGIRMPAA